MKNIIAAVLLVFSGQAFASFLSDLWYVPSEPGWGVNIIHQDRTLFATIFVYGSDGSPSWYVASNMTYNGGGSYAGDLYQTRGPFFGSTFNSNAVSVSTVGTASFSALDEATATFAYSVNGITTSKQIKRQTFKSPNLSGDFVAVFKVSSSSTCAISLPGGIVSLSISDGAQVSVTQTNLTGGTCTFQGTKSQFGKVFDLVGTSNCSGSSFPLIFFNGQYDGRTISATYRATGNCTETGYLAAIKK